MLDEAHYFLHDADALRLLDLTFNGYTVVTYRASRLPKLMLFNMARRLTPHVRHREKYVDVPVPENRAFLFSTDGQRSATSIRPCVRPSPTSDALRGVRTYV